MFSTQLLTLNYLLSSYVVAYGALTKKRLRPFYLNALHLNISMYILHSVPHTFLKVLTRRNSQKKTRASLVCDHFILEKKSLQESTNRASEQVPFSTSYLQLALAHARNLRV